MIRRYGERVTEGQRYRRRPGAYAILAREREMLLTHQAVPLPEYQLPGGGIDQGESALRALHREVWEETGWSIQFQRWLGTYRRFTYMPEYGFWAEKICHIFLARPVMRLSDPVEPAHQAVWVRLEDGANLLTNSGDQAFLRAYIAGR